MRSFNLAYSLCLVILALLSACSSPPENPAPSSTPTFTPDLCGSSSLPGEVEKVHKNMREFDDASLIAFNTPRDQVSVVIKDLQKIRRQSEDQVVPPCLAVLKQVQLAHMNTVIETLVAFLGGADQQTLNNGVELSRQQRNQYALEYAKLLGLTLVIPPVYPTDTPQPATQTPASAETVIYLAINSSAKPVNLYSEPSENSTIASELAIGGSVRVITQNLDGKWYEVELPDQNGKTAWVLVSSVAIILATPSP